MKQPWIKNNISDSLFVLLPPFACLAIVVLFPSVFQNNDHMPVAGWVIMVLLVDVGHVYSTLYRTYFDRTAVKQHRFVLFVIPFTAFAAGVLVYGFSSAWFWSLLAYVAVYHFIRQQYGFMRLYSRYEEKNNWLARIDTITIYTVTIYPVAYWHFGGPRNFNWFIKNDFFYFKAELLLNILTMVYYMVLLFYFFSIVWVFTKKNYFNAPKFFVITGTMASWYFGIVYFNGDMAFTLLNVVSHGVPYMALIWMHGTKTYTEPQGKNRFLHFVFSKKGLLVFLIIIFGFAFAEEFLWDILVWDEHRSVFGGNHFSNVGLSKEWLNFVVPLLAVPQLTHYIIDGFIWKIKKDSITWSKSRINSPA